MFSQSNEAVRREREFFSPENIQARADAKLQRQIELEGNFAQRADLEREVKGTFNQNADLTRRGQDLAFQANQAHTAALTRGQDLTFQTNQAHTGALTRGQDLTFQAEQARTGALTRGQDLTHQDKQAELGLLERGQGYHYATDDITGKMTAYRYGVPLSGGTGNSKCPKSMVMNSIPSAIRERSTTYIAACLRTRRSEVS